MPLGITLSSASPELQILRLRGVVPVSRPLRSISAPWDCAEGRQGTSTELNVNTAPLETVKAQLGYAE
ncbi:uncharacterized protein FFB20_13855 [Fusarium fujikuroi]|nr:uncharacterized protein FFC1_08268 [Fusarium fujikuroi]SCO09775.1 uncharacterized protein FFE2_11854 [Fusarium fujikuroi]SCO11639.1 uncharacterized protein FFB20_13855 [Fusarium fujikuroi]SCO49277.1 uncharacterized protein FFNC_12529 [Fusarium fujikuroi]SCV55700.1 uncharacterized protein FFFS_11864 [Fusarium fujikuroi]